MSITIKRDLGGKMRHAIAIGKHALVADEPPEHGGEDSGPTPHDLYDAALGACKALLAVVGDDAHHYDQRHTKNSWHPRAGEPCAA